MRFSHKKFFDGYKATFDPVLEQRKVDALEFLLSSFEKEPMWKDVRHIAYAFATMHVETFIPKTGQRYEPVIEQGGDSYFNKYNGRKDLGNTQKGDGLRFKGRGFLQITGRANYTNFSEILKIDLVGNPALALDPKTSFRIMTLGMFRGEFTGKKLSDYINDTKTDYRTARRIINKLDRAAEIAGYARSFESILRASKVSTASPVENPLENPEVKTPDETSDDTQKGEPSNTETKVSVIDGNVEVETSEGTQEKEKVAIELSKPQNFLQKMWAKITGFFGGASIMDVATEKAAQANTLGLSPEMWKRIFWIALFCGIVWILSEFYRHWQWKKEQKQIDELLVTANSTDSNHVTLAASGDLEKLKAAGYRIVKRGEERLTLWERLTGKVKV